MSMFQNNMPQCFNIPHGQNLTVRFVVFSFRSPGRNYGYHDDPDVLTVVSEAWQGCLQVSYS